MQSMTTPTSAQELQSCYVKIGAYMLAEDPVAYANVYQPVYDWYLHNIAGTAPTVAARAQRPAPTSRPARQAQPQRAANETTGRQRNRATPGTPGPKDAQVLAKIVATPAIAIEPLRRYFEAPTRQMTSNILGTAISRLLKAGYITGMPKVGPFTATAMGVEAAKKVTSINTRRRASSKAATGATAAETTEQAAAAG
jgi:hypothetical protein